MPKISFDSKQAFAALVGLYTGTQMGKQEFRHERRQEDDQAFRDSLLLGRLEDEQFEREAEPYRLAASAPGQTPESMQQTFKAYQELQARRPPSASLKAAQGVFQKRYPGMPFPTSTPPIAAPGQGPSAPAPQFRNPGEEEARESLLLDLRGTIRNLIDNGDEAGAQKARAVGVRLSKREITPEQAIAELGTVEQQGRVTASQDRTLETGFARLQKLHDEQRIKNEALPQAKRVLSAYAAAPPSGTERRVYLQHLRDEELAGLESSDYLQMSPDDQQRMELAKGYAFERLRAGVEDLLTKGAKAGNQRAALDLYDQAWQRANSKEGRDAGIAIDPDFDPTPRQVAGADPSQPPRIETPEEVDARRMGAASTRLDDPKAQSALRQRAIALYERLLTSGKLGEGSIQPVLERLEGLFAASGGEIRLGDLKLNGLTEAQKEQLRQFNERMKLQREQFGRQKFQEDRRYKLDADRLNLERQKFSDLKASRGKAKSPEDAKREERQFDEAQKQRGLASQIIRSIKGKEYSLDPDGDAAALKDAQAKYDAAEKTINGIIGTVPARGIVAPDKAAPSGSDNYSRYLARMRANNAKQPASNRVPDTVLTDRARKLYPNTAPR